MPPTERTDVDGYVDDPLFDLTPVPHFKRGDRVLVQTMWGYSSHRVIGVGRDRAGHPVAELDDGAGASFLISIARLQGVLCD